MARERQQSRIFDDAAHLVRALLASLSSILYGEEHIEGATDSQPRQAIPELATAKAEC